MLARILIVLWFACIASAKAQDVGQDWQNFLRQSFSLSTLAVPPATASFSAFVGKPAGFGSGSSAFGLHYGVALADNVNGKFMRSFALPLIAKESEQDYVRLGPPAAFSRRLGHVLLHSVITDQGFNWSGMPASAASAALSNAYQPSEQVTLRATAVRVGTNHAGFLLSDFASEFACDLPVVKSLAHCK